MSQTLSLQLSNKSAKPVFTTKPQPTGRLSVCWIQVLKGCIAVKTRHGKVLADFIEKLQKQIGANGVQLVTISRPSAYGEYEPYEIMESKEKFQERVLSL